MTVLDQIRPDARTLDIAVGGMSCASCVGRVEKAIAAVPGVTHAAVNLASGRATIRGSGIASDIVAAVEAAGYDATPVRDEAQARDREQASREAEQSGLKRALIVAAIATLPLLVLEMGAHLYPPLHHGLADLVGETPLRLIALALASIVLFGPGRRFFAKGFPALARGAPDMNSLVMLGAGASWLYSTIAIAVPDLLPAGADGTYFESGAVIVTLILAGRWFEAGARDRTSGAIRKLLALQPPTARVLRAGEEHAIPAGDVAVGDIVVIRPGERIPVDGEVIDGETFVDESMMTGEPAPARKQPGGSVTGGTVNGAGALRITARRVGADTLLAGIVRTVEAAQGAKLPIQAVVDRITLWFVPAVMALALATFLAWLVFGPSPGLAHALVNAVAVLIIACPCAMGLATPTSIMVGTGRAAELGILFRQGDALQELKDATIVALDKTGTLTLGKPTLTAVTVAPGFSEDEVLRLAAAVESRSEHPVALAIIAAAKTRGLASQEPQDFRAEPGLGVSATVEGRPVSIGAERLMARDGIDIAPFAEIARGFAEAGATPLHLAVDGRLAAILSVTDPVKPTTPAAIAALKQLGLRVVMITGDNRLTAQRVAAELGIDEVLAQVLPGEKAAAVKSLQAGGAKVAFVGDGINDAPALAQADIGIAIGTGTDIAIESADVVLMSGDLTGVVRAVALSQAVIANIRQNLIWAFGYNVVLIPVAAGALYPAFGILMSPMFAGLAMALSSVSVLANALRLKRFAPPVAAR